MTTNPDLAPRRAAAARIAASTPEEAERIIARYLPGNYRVAGVTTDALAAYVGQGRAVYKVRIEGRDNAGWTLDGYVIPRLGSGLYSCVEVTS